MPIHAKRALALTIATAALAFAGCGGSDDSGGSDDGLTAAVPADSPVYFEAAVRPSSEQSDAIDSIAAKFPGGADIGQRLISELDKSIAEDNTSGAPLSYAQDIDPWLGERAAFFFTSFKEDTDGSLVAEVTDEDAARAALEKFAAADDKTEKDAEHEGVKYSVDSEGDAQAVTDGRLLVGSESGVKEAISTLEGGDNISGADGYQDGVDRVGGDDALAFFYLDIDRTIDLAAESDDGSSDTSPDEVRRFLDATGVDTEKEISASLTPVGEDARAVFSVPAGEGEGSAADLVAQLPADSAFATASGSFGSDFAKGFNVALVFAKGFNVALEEGNKDDGTEDEIEAQKKAINAFLGFDLADLGDSIGGAGLFVRGTNLKDIQFGAVAEVTDPGKIGEAVDNIQGLLSAGGESAVSDLSVPGAEKAFAVQDPNTPFPIEVAYDSEKLVVGGGAGSAALALSPPETLADAPVLGALEDSLEGAEPSVFADLPKLLELLQGTGATAGDPGYATAAPYLAALGQFAAGRDGDEDGYLISRAVLNFTGAPSTPAPDAGIADKTKQK